MQPLLRAIMAHHLRLIQTGLLIVPANIGPSILQAGLISLTTAIATSANEYCRRLLIRLIRNRSFSWHSAGTAVKDKVSAPSRARETFTALIPTNMVEQLFTM